MFRIVTTRGWCTLRLAVKRFALIVSDIQEEKSLSKTDTRYIHRTSLVLQKKKNRVKSKDSMPQRFPEPPKVADVSTSPSSTTVLPSSIVSGLIVVD